MSIAFPTILIFFLILPGFIFNLYFYNIENTQLSYAPLTRKTVSSVFAAMLLNLFGFPFLVYFSHGALNTSLLFTVLSAIPSGPYETALHTLGDDFSILLIYFVLLSLFAYITAIVFRWLIKRFDLEHIGFFRLDNPWYYLFSGYDWKSGTPDFVMIAATLQLGNDVYLYVGILEDYFFDDKGNIDRLVLTDVKRRKIGLDKHQVPAGEARFYPVDGDYFVLKYAEAKNLNVQFIQLEKIP
ncbi:MAG: hypothetical protein K0S08_141 [Gammaproteobacteria bacterium]|nr:hypothetical protein [Gammaproteobacteria bacterium]